MAKKGKKNIAKGVGLGIALAAAAGAIIAFSGEKGKKRRKKVAKWATDMQKEAIDALKSSKQMTKKMYNSIVDELEEKYATAKNVNKKELAMLAIELKDNWDHIQKAAKDAHKEVKKAVRTTKKETKAAAKSTKKSAKRSASKTKRAVKK